MSSPISRPRYGTIHAHLAASHNQLHCRIRSARTVRSVTIRLTPPSIAGTTLANFLFVFATEPFFCPFDDRRRELFHVCFVLYLGQTIVARTSSIAKRIVLERTYSCSFLLYLRIVIVTPHARREATEFDVDRARCHQGRLQTHVRPEWVPCSIHGGDDTVTLVDLELYCTVQTRQTGSCGCRTPSGRLRWRELADIAVEILAIPRTPELVFERCLRFATDKKDPMGGD